MKDAFSYKPDSKERMERLLLVWEAAFGYRKLISTEQTREKKYKIQEENEFSNSEMIVFLHAINQLSFKENRRLLLDNGSTLVRRGRRTRPRKKT
jgi:hypothetical protein